MGGLSTSIATHGSMRAGIGSGGGWSGGFFDDALAMPH
ncbi:hypothetical protein SS05631_d65460 (plasmid) [Sinorhizobium sp. CCBAU 05631]|nr:hypothetical protein SS05631_d65460 [Sinorhizobium sp. CCBAU 05631]